MRDLFISYAQKDPEEQKFAERLRTDLLAHHEGAFGRNLTVWMDKYDDVTSHLSPEEMLARAIDESATFLLIVTPTSLAPESFCLRELDRAARQGKRLVEVLRREVLMENVPPALAAAEAPLIRMREGIDDYSHELRKLIDFITQDPFAARVHTDLLERAEDWARNGRRWGWLAPSGLLRDGRRWLRERTREARPEPTRLQEEYVAASAAYYRRRRAAVAMAFCAAMVVTLTAIRWRAQNRSREIAASVEATIADDPVGGVGLARDAWSAFHSPEAATALRRALDVEQGADMFRTTGRVNDGSFDAQGTRLLTTSADGSIEVWDIERKLCLLHWPPPPSSLGVFGVFVDEGRVIVGAQVGGQSVEARAVPVGAVLWTVPMANIMGLRASADGRRVAATDLDGNVLLVDVASGQVITRRRLFASGQCVGRRCLVLPLSDGRLLAAGGRYLTTWSAESSTPKQEPVSDPGIGEAVASEDGTRFALLVGNEVRVHDAITGGLLMSVALERDENALPLIALDGRGAHLAAWQNSRRRSLRVWRVDAPDRPFLKQLDDPGSEPITLSMAHDGRWLASGSADGGTYVWETEGGELPIRRLPQLDDRIILVTFSRDGALLASSGRIGGVRVTRWATASPNTGEPVAALAFDASGQGVASASERGVVRWWDHATGAQRALKLGRTTAARIRALAVDGRGRVAAVGEGGEGSMAWLWDSIDTDPRVFAVEERVMRDVSLCPDGRWLVAATADVIYAWSVSASGDAQRLEPPRPPAEIVRVTCDERGKLTAATERGQVMVWDSFSAVPYEPCGRPAEGTPPNDRTLLSSDAHTLIEARGDGPIRITDLATCQRRAVRVPGVLMPLGVAVDGSLIALRTGDDIEMVDVASGSAFPLAREPTDQNIRPTALALSADGRWLALGDDRGVVRRYSRAAFAPPEELRPMAESIVGVDSTWLARVPEWLVR